MNDTSKSDFISAPLRVSPVFAAVTLTVWGILTFGHGTGLKIAAALYNLARNSDFFHPEGGMAGFARMEMLVAFVFIALAASIMGALAWNLRHMDRNRLVEAALPWFLWVMLLYLIRKCFIIFTTEFVHFAQYALIGALAALTLERGKRPQLAFMITLALGFLDEAWQHYGLHNWLMGQQNHWMDWSDVMLNALGACGGILPFTTEMRLRKEVSSSEFHLVRGGFIIAGLLFLPLVFIDPVTTSQTLGHYPYYPFWVEWSNHKPVHWLLPGEGIPLCLSLMVIIGLMLDPRRRHLSIGWIAVLIILTTIAIRPESRIRGREVHEAVATVQAPWIMPPTVNIDGVLDEPAWQQAPRIGPFVNNSDGQPELTRFEGGDRSLIPIKKTYARVFWGDKALYLAFEVEDEDLWARDVMQDEYNLQKDEGIKIFIDDGGDEITFYQFEITPLNRVYDAFNLKAAAPIRNEQIALTNWNAPNLRTAVKVRGTIDAVPEWDAVSDRDQDRGYVVEVAIPWETFSNGNRIVQPQPGERWRLGLFRIERPRPDLDPDLSNSTTSADRARRLIGVTEEKFAKLIENGSLKPTAEGENTFLFKDVRRQAAIQRTEQQAWTPTYGGFNNPERFGVIEFLKEEK